MKYYFAGGLFDHKELIGNKLLADAIADVSEGHWEALLPQDEENQLRDDPKSIRDNDFQMVLLGKCRQLRHTGHGAVVVHDFNEGTGREEAAQLAEVYGRLGMSATAQHAVVLGI